jgi:hypothetical protein
MALITIVSAVVNASGVPVAKMRWHVENKREFDLPRRASPDAIGISCRETAKLAGVIRGVGACAGFAVALPLGCPLRAY